MKRINNTWAKACLMAIGALSVAVATQAATYTWRGTNSTAWTTAGNWLALSVGPTGTAGLGHRLDVNNAGFNGLVYDASLGTTYYGSAGAGAVRGFAIGSGGNGSGTLTISGGTFITTNGNAGDIVGNSDNNTGILNISGGTLVSGSATFAIGLGGGNNRTSVLNVNSGSATVGSVSINTLRGTINLNGGALVASNIVVSSIAGVNATNNFNGGTLQARGSTTGFYPLAPLAVSRAQIRTNAAIIDTAGFDITIAQPLIHSTITGDPAIDGGLNKIGAGTLTLSGVPSYTGPTIVNAGQLTAPLPTNSSTLTVAAGAKFSAGATNAAWRMASAAVTNATLEFNYGSWSVNSYTNEVMYVTNLALSGSVTCNISGTAFSAAKLTLLSYAGKTGGGSFVLGTLPTFPAGVTATFNDDGTNVTLNIVSIIQNLVWSGGDGIWQTNGGNNWNANSLQYKEYGSGIADLVTFNDTYSGVGVTLGSVVAPGALTVNTTNFFGFQGSGVISGTNPITKLGSGFWTIANSNDFSSTVTVNGGSINVNNPNALGSTSGPTVVSSGAQVKLGVGGAVTVTGEPLTISGSGTDSTYGALRSANGASGPNVWDGPVILGATGARIGAEDSGSITVSGNITDNGTNYSPLFRVGLGSTVTISGTNNSWGGASQIFGSMGLNTVASTLLLGANNAFPTNRQIQIGNCILDLNGFNQTCDSLALTSFGNTVSLYSTIGNSGSTATLTLNSTNNGSFSGNITGNIAINKLGTNTQTFSGAILDYAGDTMVNAGRLNLPTNTMNTSITVAGGAVLSGEPTTAGNLTLQTNSTLYVDGSTVGSLTANTIDASGLPIMVGFTAPPASGADIIVLKATGGTITGSAANFQLLPGLRGTGSFSLQNGDTELHYLAATAPSLVWKGNNVTNPTFWDTTTTNWLNGVSPDKFWPGDDVTFDDTASNFVVAAQGTVLPSAVTFNNSISNYTVYGVIGSGTVTKSGSAIVTMTGANTYNGETYVTGGTVVVQNNSALGSKIGGTTVTNGGTLDLGGTLSTDSLNIGAEVLTVSGTGVGGNGVVVNNGINTQINAVQRMILAGNTAIGGSQRWDIRGTSWLDMGGYTLTKKGANYIALVGTLLTNTPGNIIVEGGTFAIQTSTDIGGSSANTLTLQSGSILNNYANTFAQPWTLIMESNTTYQANNGVSTNNIWSGPVTLNGPASLEVFAYITISGNVSGTGSITKTGTGVATLSGVNSYAGGTTISAGRLAINGSLASGPVAVAGNSTLSGSGSIGGAVTVAATGKVVPGDVGANFISGIGTLTVSSLTLSNSTTADFEIQDTSTMDRVAVTSSGGLTFGQCAFNLYNPGTNSAYSGADGTYTLFTYTGTLNGILADLSVANPAAGRTYVFATNATEVQVIIGTAPTPLYWGVDSDGSWASSGNWSPTTVPNVQFATANIGGPGSPVSFSAPRAITLDGAYTLGALVLDTTQPFTVNQGTSGNLVFDNGSASGLITENSGSHTINAPVVVSVKGLNLSAATNTTLSLNGAVSGSGGLTLSGIGTSVLGGASTYTGNTLINAGILVVSNNAALGSSTGATTINSGTSANAASVVLANGVTVTGETISINGYGQNVRGSLQAASGATAEWAGPVKLGTGASADNNRIGAAANGTLKVSGIITNGTIADLFISADAANGKVIVSGANAFTGKVGIIRGTLQLGANNSLPASALLDVHSAGNVSDASIFEMAGYSQTVAGITRGGTGGAAMITNSGSLATLTISTTNSYSYAALGGMGGAIALVKEGTGTQALTVATTYTGNTTVNGGTLALSQATLNTNSTVSITNGAVLQLNFTTTNQVAALILNGTNQPGGVYNSTNAAPFITGTGSLVVPITAPPTLTFMNLGANQLQFAWTGGGTLQSQTNSLNAGLGTNWVDYPGASPVTVTVDPSAGSVFFRVKQ